MVVPGLAACWCQGAAGFHVSPAPSQAFPEEHCHLNHASWVLVDRGHFWMSLFQWGDVTETSVWLCDLQVLDLEKAASCLWSWLITCEAASRMIVLFPWIINKPVSYMDGVRGAWHPLFFLSFVQQLCFLGQRFINSCRWWREKKEMKTIFPSNMFFSYLESSPLLSHHLGSHSTKVWGLPWVGGASGSAPNTGSRLQTGHDLEMQQLVQQMAHRLAPLGLETHTIFFLQPRQPHSC